MAVKWPATSTLGDGKEESKLFLHSPNSVSESVAVRPLSQLMVREVECCVLLYNVRACVCVRYIGSFSLSSCVLKRSVVASPEGIHCLCIPTRHYRLDQCPHLFSLHFLSVSFYHIGINASYIPQHMNIHIKLIPPTLCLQSL